MQAPRHCWLKARAPPLVVRGAKIQTLSHHLLHVCPDLPGPLALVRRSFRRRRSYTSTCSFERLRGAREVAPEELQRAMALVQQAHGCALGTARRDRAAASASPARHARARGCGPRPCVLCDGREARSRRAPIGAGLAARGDQGVDRHLLRELSPARHVSSVTSRHPRALSSLEGAVSANL